MRIVPRRMVWQRTVPSSFTIRVQQDKRKAPFKCCSGGLGFERQSAPSITSTTHSLHFPCLLHEVGTGTPSLSAQVKSEQPVSASLVWELKCNCTLIGRGQTKGR